MLRRKGGKTAEEEGKQTEREANKMEDDGKKMLSTRIRCLVSLTLTVTRTRTRTRARTLTRTPKAHLDPNPHPHPHPARGGQGGPDQRLPPARRRRVTLARRLSLSRRRRTQYDGYSLVVVVTRPTPDAPHRHLSRRPPPGKSSLVSKKYDALAKWSEALGSLSATLGARVP